MLDFYRSFFVALPVCKPRKDDAMTHQYAARRQSDDLKIAHSPTRDAETEISDDAAYAQENDLPMATDPAGWYGRTRAIIYYAAFRDTFAEISRQHQRQARAGLKKFVRVGSSYGSIKIETIQTNRGWVPRIPADVHRYQCARLSYFLRLAYNLIGNDRLIVYNIGRKNEYVGL